MTDVTEKIRGDTLLEKAAKSDGSPFTYWNVKRAGDGFDVKNKLTLGGARNKWKKEPNVIYATISTGGQTLRLAGDRDVLISYLTTPVAYERVGGDAPKNMARKRAIASSRADAERMLADAFSLARSGDEGDLQEQLANDLTAAANARAATAVEKDAARSIGASLADLENLKSSLSRTVKDQNIYCGSTEDRKEAAKKARSPRGRAATGKAKSPSRSSGKGVVEKLKDLKEGDVILVSLPKGQKDKLSLFTRKPVSRSGREVTLPLPGSSPGDGKTFRAIAFENQPQLVFNPKNPGLDRLAAMLSAQLGSPVTGWESYQKAESPRRAASPKRAAAPASPRVSATRAASPTRSGSMSRTASPARSTSPARTAAPSVTRTGGVGRRTGRTTRG